MLSVSAFFNGIMSQKHSTRVPSSYQWQKTDNSSTAVISVHSSSITLKTDAFWSLYKIDSLTHVPSSSIKSTTALREVYAAFLRDFNENLQLSSPIRWFWVRKWVQRTRDFIAAIFFSLSCIPTFCSYCTTEPCFDAASRAWLAWVWRLLLSWAFVLPVAFFQFWNGFVTKTPPVCSVALPAMVCLQTLQKHHWCLHHALASWTRFPSSSSIFSSLSNAESTLYKPSWRVAQQHQKRNQNSWILFTYGY